MTKKKRTKGGIDGFVFGTARLFVGADDLINLLNVLLEMGESYKNIFSDGERASVDISYPAAKLARKFCAERGIEAELKLFFGLPYIVSKVLKRPGLIAGMAAAILLLSLGSRVLWDVRVEGNELISDNEIKEILAEHGVRPGAWLEKLDIGMIQTNIEMSNEDIAWISVNVIGTVAYVEVIEAVIPPESLETEGDGINLVASHDGVIVGFEVIAGEPTAEIGQTVRAGELLVSGLLDSERLGWRAIESKGKVLARAEYIFEVEIPYEYTVRLAEKSEICEISIIFFSFRQKFFKKGGFSGSEYDKIYSDIYIYSSGGATIPIGLEVVRTPIFTETAAARTQSEAVDLAYFELNRQILADLPEAEILSKSFSGEENADGTAYRLVCRVTCIEDIAEEKAFYITNP